MSSWWQRLKASLGGGEPLPKPPEKPPDDLPERECAKWLDASGTPFGVPVLDLISITGPMLSSTAVLEYAERAISWRSSVGDELDAAALLEREPVVCALRYPADPLLSDGLLFAPSEMEQKWVVALRGQRILLARSWTGVVFGLLDGRREGDELIFESLYLHDDSGLGMFGDPLQTVDWLIRTHALGQVLPLPVDDEGATLLERTPLLAMNAFGHMARCAAKSWDPPAPRRPLRTDNRVMQAVRDEDLPRVRELAGAGEPLDAPSPTQGFRPLGVAVIKNNPELVQLLLELGADPNLGDDRGMVPLGRAVVHGGDEAMLDLLLAAGARTDAVNVDEFGLLHAVAETGRAELIPWMLAHGVALETRTRHGHTPLHIACALGHVDAARALLRAGADPKAPANDGNDALAIATAQQQPEIVALLQP
ncbi:MAG TPA: ankyrin repeat domain-containing protein [Enhygromyxa sp.]|nr:ankyrin repeat domain-containing protein [Enhygromyxa sp.]